MKFTLIKDTSAIKEVLTTTPEQRAGRKRGVPVVPFGLTPETISAAQIMYTKLKQGRTLNAQLQMLSEN